MSLKANDCIALRASRCGGRLTKKNLGIAAFSFFALKGLAWLVIPAAIAVGVPSCGDDNANLNPESTTNTEQSK